VTVQVSDILKSREIARISYWMESRVDCRVNVNMEWWEKFLTFHLRIGFLSTAELSVAHECDHNFVW